MKGFLVKYLKIISVLKNAWRVLKKLRSTTRSTRVKFGLKLFYILKHFNKSEFVVPKLLLRKIKKIQKPMWRTAVMLDTENSYLTYDLIDFICDNSFQGIRLS